jgi:hypothetical protein
MTGALRRFGGVARKSHGAASVARITSMKPEGEAKAAGGSVLLAVGAKAK